MSFCIQTRFTSAITMFAVLLSPCTIEQQVETCQARTWEPLSTQNIVLAHPMTSLILSKMVVTAKHCASTSYDFIDSQ